MKTRNNRLYSVVGINYELSWPIILESDVVVPRMEETAPIAMMKMHNRP